MVGDPEQITLMPVEEAVFIGSEWFFYCLFQLSNVQGKGVLSSKVILPDKVNFVKLHMCLFSLTKKYPFIGQIKNKHMSEEIEKTK